MGRSISGELVTNVSVPVMGLSQNPFEIITGQSVFGKGQYAVFYNSGTFTIPNDATLIRVSCYGAGGSGASSAIVATGGAGGGLSIKTLSVTPGTTYPITVGNGGSVTTTTDTANGQAGGSSSFGVILSATGGNGGIAMGVVSTAAGATAGTGSGGDYNFTGGNSGSITIAATTNATGGGSAPSILGNGFPSGDVTNNSFSAVSGGASCRNKSANRVSISGGSGGAGIGGENLTEDIFGGPSLFGTIATSGNGEGYPSYVIPRFLGDGFSGGGGAGSITGTSGNGGPGAGGGASLCSSQAIGGKGGVFGGGGAAFSTGSTAFGGNGGLGAGGGASLSTGVNQHTAGKGGNGLVIIEW